MKRSLTGWKVVCPSSTNIWCTITIIHLSRCKIFFIQTKKQPLLYEQCINEYIKRCAKCTNRMHILSFMCNSLLKMIMNLYNICLKECLCAWNLVCMAMTDCMNVYSNSCTWPFTCRNQETRLLTFVSMFYLLYIIVLPIKICTIRNSPTD